MPCCSMTVLLHLCDIYKSFVFNFSTLSRWMRSVVLLSGSPSWWRTATYLSDCTRRLGFTRTINSWKKCHVVSRSNCILRGILWCLIRVAHVIVRGSVLVMKTNWHGMILPFLTDGLLYTWTLDRMLLLTVCCTSEHLTECLYWLFVVHPYTW